MLRLPAGPAHWQLWRESHADNLITVGGSIISSIGCVATQHRRSRSSGCRVWSWALKLQVETLNVELWYLRINRGCRLGVFCSKRFFRHCQWHFTCFQKLQPITRLLSKGELPLAVTVTSWPLRHAPEYLLDPNGLIEQLSTEGQPRFILNYHCYW